MPSGTTPLVSVVTACFNSSAFLQRTYRSVLAQTYGALEWVVVEDLSRDDTVGQLQDLQGRHEVEMRLLLHRINQGPVLSIKEGVQAARGELTFILDHDDELTPDALTSMVDYWVRLDGDRNAYSGVGGRCVDEHGRFIGTPFRSSPLITNELEIRHVHRIRGELAGVVRSGILKEAYAAMMPGMTNGFVWRRIARRHNAIYTNDVVRVYHTNVPGSMSNTRRLVDVDGAMRQYCIDLNENSDMVHRDPLYFLRCALLYGRLARHAGRPLREAWHSIESGPSRAMFLCGLPLLPLVLLRDRVTGRAPGLR